MQIDKRERDGAMILAASGKLHHGVGDVQLRETVDAVLEAGHKRLVLDLADVRSMDSSGLGELVRTKVTAQRHGAQIKLANLDMKVFELLTMSQLVPMFEIYDSEAEAVASFE